MSEKIQEFAVVRLGYNFLPNLDQVFCVSCTKEKKEEGITHFHAVAILKNTECYGCSIVMQKSHDTILEVEAEDITEEDSYEDEDVLSFDQEIKDIFGIK